MADLVGVSRNTISPIETGQFCPTAKLALVLCIALDKKFEELFSLNNSLCLPLSVIEYIIKSIQTLLKSLSQDNFRKHDAASRPSLTIICSLSYSALSISIPYSVIT